MPRKSHQICLPGLRIRFHPSLIAFALIFWGVAQLYLPIVFPEFTGLEPWLLSAVITVISLLSLFLHLLTHRVVSRIFRAEGYDRLPLGFFGDLAHRRPFNSSISRELLISASGPFMNFALASLSYTLWNAQVSPALNAIFSFCALFNLFIGALNLAPFFPFDGGRITQILLFPFLSPFKLGSKVLIAGRMAAGCLFLWGIFLVFRGIQYGRESGLFTMFLSLLIFWESWGVPASAPQEQRKLKALKAAIAFLLIPVMLLFFLSFLPLSSGLEAPGTAIQVEGMIEFPHELLHPPEGHFLLTSVFSQTPILFAEWLYAKVDPSVEIVPPESVIPPDITPQEWMRMNYRNLEESEANAIYVALTLAGYTATLVGEGARVISIIEESPARGILQNGDVIVEANGVKVEQTKDLVEVIQSADPEEKLLLTVKRGQEILTLETSLIEPRTPSEKPYLGITVESAGLELKTPFPVEITPQKIVGGPSAGLMFALSLYNLLTPGDLTGGRLIAGTGTIDPEGNVGPIGGVERKVVAAERAGAEYFFVPQENYEDVCRAARNIRVIQVKTIREAIQFLESLK